MCYSDQDILSIIGKLRRALGVTQGGQVEDFTDQVFLSGNENRGYDLRKESNVPFQVNETCLKPEFKLKV